MVQKIVSVSEGPVSVSPVSPSPVSVSERPVADEVADLARSARAVLIAGVPGVGKSLLLKELTQAAQALGRPVTCLQWDVVRDPIEEADGEGRFPEIDGVTDSVIRVAAGCWTRKAIARWLQTSAENEILVGELPLVGNRLMEVVCFQEDEAEALLSHEMVQIIVPVPSVEVRRVIEEARRRSNGSPSHEREKGDASPAVLASLWAEVSAVAEELGLSVEEEAAKDSVASAGADGSGSADASSIDLGSSAPSPPYSPALYERLYGRLLAHRHTRILRIGEVRKALGSVYEIGGPVTDMMPTLKEGRQALVEVERRFTSAEIDNRVAHWWCIGSEGNGTSGQAPGRS